MIDHSTFPSVDSLSLAALDVKFINRDWSEGYGETWRYVAAPDCVECGSTCHHIAGDDLGDHPDYADAMAAIEDNDGEPKWASESYEDWRCVNVECDRFGERSDEDDNGPMMNYSYELPGFVQDEYEAARKIAHLPLCIILSENPHHDEVGFPALALTGGGMNLTWEIAEAFMRLGYLPPIDYCDLPAMCGRGTLSNELSDRDRWIINGCRRAIKEQRARTTNTLDRLERKIVNL